MTKPKPAARTQDQLEQDALQHLLDRHRNGTENDIRQALIDFMLAAQLITPQDYRTEAPTGTDQNRIDIAVKNAYFELKTNVFRGAGDPNPDYIAQLDRYIQHALEAGHGVKVGILTDGRHYLRRTPESPHQPLNTESILTINDASEHARLREYLRDALEAPATDIAPTPENLAKHLGRESELYQAAMHLLRQSYQDNKANPTVKVKRDLWQNLLQVALGRNSVGDRPESDELYLRHTYITSLIALIMHQRLLKQCLAHARQRPLDLLKGVILLEQSDLRNIIDADLFTWPAEAGTTEYLEKLAAMVERFDWESNPREIAPTLYQNVITQEERKQLGEYYTPRWLAEEITIEVVDEPLKQKTLDPSCGSGTFIETGCQLLIRHATIAGLSAQATLQLLQENIIGIDLHPVAVQLSKATWVLTCADVIIAARAEGKSTHQPVNAPIYLGDSLQLRYNTGTLQATAFIELKTEELLPRETETLTFQVPKALAQDQVRIDFLLAGVGQAIDQRQNPELWLQSQAGELAPDHQESMKVIARQMQGLHAQGRNHVWSYYIRNMIRPAAIAERKVDRIIGNPPWLTYNQAADIIKDELREMSDKRYGIWAGGKQAPHQDLASLFYVRVAELYAQPGTKLGMVMPHSALRSGQHLKFRTGTYRQKNRAKTIQLGLDFQASTPWDLDNVEPDLFPMPACVIFAESKGMTPGQALAPGKVTIYRGTWNEEEVNLERDTEALHHNDDTFKSPYAERAYQGATIFDRQLFFVEELPNESAIPAANTTRVKARHSVQEKIDYGHLLQPLEGALHNNHLFDVYAGECIAPYSKLAPLRAALPVNKETMAFPEEHSKCSAKEHNECNVDISQLDWTMARRWNLADELYREKHKELVVKTLYHRLNFLRKLSRQLKDSRQNKQPRLVYSTAGMPTATLIKEDHAIIDTALYYIDCTQEEGQYLCTVLNSETMRRQVEPLMSRGNFGGGRNLHKHLWKLPIPEYDTEETVHQKLSTLGKAAAEECAARISQSDIMSRPAGDPQSRAARRLLRHEWQPNSPTAQEIETLVNQLLSDPHQAELAAQQMKAAKNS